MAADRLPDPAEPKRCKHGYTPRADDRPNVEAPLIVWEYAFALERQNDVLLAVGERDRQHIERLTAELQRKDEALESTDGALRSVLAGEPVRDVDEILSRNAWLLFADPANVAAVLADKEDAE